tara:strand:- start:159 stop:908 length:750 start_codon:yes stop_codon:yes gene_type:complete
MIENRRISSTRWWNKRNFWLLIFFFSFILFVRVSKGSLYKDFYYFISRPFWPGQFQREILEDSTYKELNVKVNQLDKDNKRLRKILELQSVSDKGTINAAVISRQTSTWWKQVILNKGKKDGVEIGDSVVGPGGLVGIIENTSFLTSSVKLLTATQSKVGVWNQRSNIHGLLVGLGNNSPILIFYSKGLDVKEGDFIFSSPASTLLPPNIPIGIIESIDNESRSTLVAVVQLLAKPEAIDWVQVLKIED